MPQKLMAWQAFNKRQRLVVGRLLACRRALGPDSWVPQSVARDRPPLPLPTWLGRRSTQSACQAHRTAANSVPIRRRATRRPRRTYIAHVPISLGARRSRPGRAHWFWKSTRTGRCWCGRIISRSP